MSNAVLIVGIPAIVLLALLFSSIFQVRRAPVSDRIEVKAGKFEEVARRTMNTNGLKGSKDRRAFDGSSVLPGTSGSSLTTGNVSTHPEMKGALLAASFIDAGIPAVDVWENWSSVDDHVYQAVSHLTHVQIDGFADLLKVVDAKGYALDSEGFFQSLKGHIGEWHAQEHFFEAGVSVAMPEASNEAGTDLWLDDHAYNVKTVADAGQVVTDHIDKYPSIGIILPHDAANIPADALHFDPSSGLNISDLHGGGQVIIDHALSNVDMADQAHNAIDVLKHPGPELHIPLATMAISTFREGRLLVKGNTDLGRAAKNIAVDTVAVGGCGALGMKVGTVIGLVGGPVSAVVGGLLGGAVGAISGRLAANSIKRKPLLAAQERYQNALSVYRDTEAKASEYASTEFEQARNAEQAKLTAEMNSLRKNFEDRMQKIRTMLQSHLTLGKTHGDALIGTAKSLIEKRIAEVEADYRMRTRGLRRLFPGLAAPEVTAQYQSLRRDFANWNSCAAELSEKWERSPGFTAKVFDLVLAVPELEGQAVRFCENAIASRQSRYRDIEKSQAEVFSNIVALRAKAVANMKTVWAGIGKQVEDMLRPAINKLEKESGEFRVELKKAGKAV